ncbi:MAG: prepilin-type N-terminal cleavage/methylation domain-containing protein, partial [Proteobacteria bacterium]|nr:prepilin-type N-terminal cleavage/methylation domain-containing protein [Pseudomonadota bacterium]
MSRKEKKAHYGHDPRMKGFTLVELMITLVILGLILGVVYRMFSSQEHFFRTQEQVSATQENLRATVEYMNQELSWLGYKVPGVAVVKASPNDLIFRANIPNTGSAIQYVRYRFDNATNTILRAAGANASDVDTADVIMASDIEALSFSFYTVQNAVVVIKI